LQAFALPPALKLKDVTTGEYPYPCTSHLEGGIAACVWVQHKRESSSRNRKSNCI